VPTDEPIMWNHELQVVVADLDERDRLQAGVLEYLLSRHKPAVPAWAG
jgi:hypothetical protein